MLLDLDFEQLFLTCLDLLQLFLIWIDLDFEQLFLIWTDLYFEHDLLLLTLTLIVFGDFDLGQD